MASGFVEAALKNWRTTASSCLTAFSAYVALFPDDFRHLPVLVHIAKFFVVGGLAAFGIAARDSLKKDSQSGN